MNQKLLVEFQYLAPISFYSALINTTNLVFEEYEFYRKMSFRNRCIVAGANGPIQLTVPLTLGRNQKTLITKVELANQYPWQEQHWKTIESCYRKSPWFDHYAPELEIFYKTDFQWLVEWDLALFRWVVNKLNIDLTIEATSKFHATYSSEEYLDLRNSILPKGYNKEAGKPYQQVFSGGIGFLRNLSILDLLFCQGKAAINYL